MNEVIGSNTVDDATALERLMKLQHIVVVMMENRSFDSMLGYLKQAELTEVDGLDGTESNPGPDGEPVEVFVWGEEDTVFHPPEDHTGKILDPCHGKTCVQEQLSNDNTGFVKSFVATRKDKHGNPVTLPPEYNRLPMGYYTAEHLPIYDFLARNYCICDAWHSSVPGDTWPNRLFALAGREGPRDLPPLIERIEKRLGHHLPFIDNAPIFNVPAFTHQLAEEQWRWYSHDPATLRAADGQYRRFDDLDRDNFAFFDRQSMSVLTKVLEAGIVGPDSFLDDCADGNLRDVSWVDPNFIDLSVLDPNSNDDHPPSDIRAGQALILELYLALRNSPHWEDTLLVVVYDEHGGFFDHVTPPRLPMDDRSGYSTYGVRVPALVVGPRVANGICHDLFDHTSLIQTILRRFASDPDQAIARMPPRVAEARHLGYVLLDDPRGTIPEPDAGVQDIGRWREQARARRRGLRGEGLSAAFDGAGRPFWLHDFQEEFLKFALAMRHGGLEPGHP
jgi:phospholipase C